MGYSQKKKDLKKKPLQPKLGSIIRSKWKQIWPILLFVLGFVVLMVLFYAFWLSDYSKSNFQPLVVSVNARVSSFILNLFGMGTAPAGGVIASTQYSVSIARGCDAMEAMALFGSALLAFPAKWKFKLIGFFAGIAILFFLNIVRIVSLFLTGVYFPSVFEFMHVEVWQALFIIFALGLWIFWIKWTKKERSHVA